MNRRPGWMLAVVLGCLGCSAGGQAPPPSASGPDPTPPHPTAKPAADDAALPPAPEAVPEQAADQGDHGDQPETAGDWLDRIEAGTRDVRSLHAKVRYVTIQGLLQDEQVRVGDLYYAAAPTPNDQAGHESPERLAVHFQREMIGGDIMPADRWLVFDGRWLLDIDHQRRQATRRQLVPDRAEADGAAARAALPLPIRLERRAVEERYVVTLLPEDDPQEKIDDAAALRFVPRPGQDAEAFDAWFDRETLLPVCAVTGDPDGDQTRVVLYDPSVNADIPDARFDTALPRGAGWDVQTVLLEDDADR